MPCMGLKVASISCVIYPWVSMIGNLLGILRREIFSGSGLEP